MNQRFSMRSALAVILLGAAAVVSACNQSASSSGSSEIAAKVNNSAIPLTKVDRQIELELKGANLKLADLSPIQLAAARMRSLDQLIQREVILQRAQRENIQASDDDVKQAVQAFITEQGWTQEDFQKQLKEGGWTEEEFRNEQRQNIIVKKLYDKQFSKIPAPSEKEIGDYYAQNRDQFKIGRGVYLSQIMVDPQNNNLKNDARSEDEAKQKIASIATRLKAGDDFATVARIASEDIQTAQRGGDMGFAPEEQLNQVYPQDLVKRFFGMREGEITEPIPGSQGRMYIFKVTGKKLEPEELKLEDPDVRKRIADVLRQQREQVLSDALISMATSESRVENYLARRVLDNPSNFGSARPTALSPVTTTAPPPAETKPAETKPTEPKADKPAETPAKDGKK